MAMNADAAKEDNAAIVFQTQEEILEALCLLI